MDDILTVKEAADIVNVPGRTVIRLGKSGTLPCFKVGSKLSRLRFKRSDVVAFAETYKPKRDDLIATSEAARMLAVSPKTVLRMASDGRLPYVRVESRYFFEEEIILKIVLVLEDTKDLMKTSDVADFLKISDSTVFEMVKSGILSRIQICPIRRSFWFRRDEILKFAGFTEEEKQYENVDGD